MATSTIEASRVIEIDGTIPDATGDMTVSNFLPTGFRPICGYYLTTYNQYRPVAVGFSGTTLILQSVTAGQANRPLKVLACKV